MKSEATKLLKQFYKQNAWSFTVGFLSMALCGITQVYAPRLVGHFIDWLQGSPLPWYLTAPTRQQSLFYFLIMFISVHVVLTIARALWRLTFMRSTHNASAWMKNMIWDHAAHFPRNAFSKEYNLGSLMNISTSDVGSARMIMGMTLVGILDVVFLGIFTFATMLSIDVQLTLYLLAILPILPPVMMKITTLEGKYFEKAQNTLSSFNQICAQAVSTVKLQRLTQTEKRWNDRLTDMAEETRQAHLKTVKTSLLFFPIMALSTVLCYGVLFYVGIHKVREGKITVGDFIAFQSLVLLIQDPLMEIGFILSEWQKGFTALKRIAKLLQEKTDSTFIPREQLIDLKMADPFLKVENLSYSYPEAKRPVLHYLSFSIQAGDRLGILGPIGSGKSTLLQILTRQIDDYEGHVEIEGHNLKSYPHQQISKLIGIVPQKPFLFADTIKYNLSLEIDATDTEIWKMLEIVHIKNEIERLPDQLNTYLGEYGVNLSGGQKQRLTLARALMRRPKLLLLDDCLSAVDANTEKIIMSNINQHFKDTTIIWVAHRSSTLKYCNAKLEFNTHE